MGTVARACRRLGAWVDAQQRGAILRALDRWRAAAAATAVAEAAACAAAVMAGELRTAQWKESEQATARGHGASTAHGAREPPGRRGAHAVRHCPWRRQMDKEQR